MLAYRGDETPRRVRARLEKEGQMDNLATQILERKAIDRILEYITVELEDVTTSAEEPAADTLDETASGAVAEVEVEQAEDAAASGDPAGKD
jgi:trigger factor